MKYFLAVCFMAAGFMMALKPDWLMNATGRIDAVERSSFSTFGGTRVFLQLVGVVMIFLAVVIAFGRFSFGFLDQFFSGVRG